MMHRSRSWVRSGLACVLAGLAGAQQLPGPRSADGKSTAIDIPRDDFKSRAVHFPTQPVHPMDFDAAGTRLYAVNPGGSRLAIFSLPGMQRIDEIPLGFGLTSVRARPGAEEAWVVDQISNCVSVVDLVARRARWTIAVGARPTSLAFSDDGSLAFVVCSESNCIDVIDTVTYGLLQRVELPMRNPVAVEFFNGRVHVVSLRSGNNTAPKGTSPSSTDDAREIHDLATLAPSVQELPDRDLISFALPSPTTPPASLDVVRGLGTVLFNVRRRPATSQLWVPNTEALNAEHWGFKNFVAGQVVENRVTIVDSDAGALVQIVDLDALIPLRTRCAQPTDVAFSPDGNLAFVSGYNSDRIAVLDCSLGVSFQGVIEIPFDSPYPRGSGPRACRVDPTGTYLYVYNKLNHSVTQIALASLPATPGYTHIAPNPISLGFNPIAREERHGLMHFLRASDSRSQTSSCASCHVDGTSDGLVWDLSEFLEDEGTPNAQLAAGLDRKGPMYTQATINLFGTAPYHWRGDRRTLRAFNQIFIDLFEREENGEPANIGADFQYIIHFMQHLAYPPNPRQELDRTLTARQARGAEIFLEKPVLDGLTCASCHSLPLGTNNDLALTGRGGLAPVGAVPDLRGLGEKASPRHFVGGDFGWRTELGAGFLHDGTGASLQDVLLRETAPGVPEFDLTMDEARSIEAFLLAFDTGIAPAAAFQVTATPQNVLRISLEDLPFLVEQARRGNCDVLFQAGLDSFSGHEVHLSGLLDPIRGVFELPSASLEPLLPSQLMEQVEAGRIVTLRGAPLRMGLQLALDRDVDGLRDFDELLHQTDPENLDTDGDTMPDGYEVEWNLDPLVGDTSPLDNTAPSLQGQPKVIYRTSRSIKLDFATSEPTRIVVYIGDEALMRLPLGNGFDTEFTADLFQLQPDRLYNVELELRDPAGNIRNVPLQYRTRPQVGEDPVSVRDITALVRMNIDGSGDMLDIELSLRGGEKGALDGYTPTFGVYHKRADGSVAVFTQSLLGGISAPDGISRTQMRLPGRTNPNQSGFLYVVPLEISAPARGAFYAEALDAKSYARVNY